MKVFKSLKYFFQKDLPIQRSEIRHLAYSILFREILCVKRRLRQSSIEHRFDATTVTTVVMFYFAFVSDGNVTVSNPSCG